MKQIFSAAVVVAAMCLLSCNGDTVKESVPAESASSTVSGDSGAAMTNTPDNTNTNSSMSADTMKNSMASGKPITAMDVTDFVKKASSGGMMEVEMGKMAGSNGQSDRVKNFGAMLVTDHTNAGNELKSMAMSNSISVPNDMMPEHKKNMDMMMNMKGAGFDKGFMDMMIKDHKKDIADYKKASTDLSDASYKAFAAKTLPTLQKHLDSAMAIMKEMK